MYFSLRYEDNGQYLRSNSANQYSIYLKNELKLADWFTLTYGSNVYLTKTEVSQSGVSWFDAMPYECVVSDEGMRFINTRKIIIVPWILMKQRGWSLWDII